MTNALYIIIVLLLGVIAYLLHERKHYKNKHDYYVSVDEVNEVQQTKIGKLVEENKELKEKLSQK